MPFPKAIPAIMSRLPWKWIGLALAVAGIGYAAYSWAWQRGHDSRDDAFTFLTAERDAALASVADLSGALLVQNAAIATQGRVQERVVKASDKAVRSGAERRGALDAAAARVEAVGPSGAVVVPDDVRGLWGKL